MSDAELAARVVMSMSGLDVTSFASVRQLAADLGVADWVQVARVARQLYERGWLERLDATSDALEAKLGSRGRGIAQAATSIEDLTRRFERGGSLVVDPSRGS